MDEEDFATELRAKTSLQHKASNAVVNLTAPLALSSPRVYRLLLASFYWIYKTLEEELEHRRRLHPKVGPIYFRELLRTAAFERDLLFYYGSDYATLIGPPSPATAEYIRELRQCVAEEPVLIIAYCQCLYIGMLAGGAIVKKWVHSAFGVPRGSGTSIFDFSDTIKDVIQFRKDYDEAINSIALSREEKDRLIERKKRIFSCNNAIFAELRSSNTYKARVLSVVARIVAIIIALYLIVRVLRDPLTWFPVTSKLG